MEIEGVGREYINTPRQREEPNCGRLGMGEGVAERITPRATGRISVTSELFLWR